MKGKSNPVAKFMNVYNRASTHSTPKDYDRKDNGWFKDWLEEDAPANATGVAVSTDKPIVKSFFKFRISISKI